MAKESTPKNYVAALGYPAGLAFSDFDSTTFEARDDETAVTMAIEWANKRAMTFDPQTWLQVSLNGRGIHSEKVGTPTSAPRT